MKRTKFFTTGQGKNKLFGVAMVQDDDISASGDTLLTPIRWYKTEKRAKNHKFNF